MLPVSFRSQTASSSRPFTFLPLSPNTSPHKRGFFACFLSPDAAASPLSRPPCDNLNRGQEGSGDHGVVVKEKEFTAIDVVARGSPHPDPLAATSMAVNSFSLTTNPWSPLPSCPFALDLDCYRDAEKEAMRRWPARGRRRKTPVCDGTYYGKGEERRKDGTTRQFGF